MKKIIELIANIAYLCRSIFHTKCKLRLKFSTEVKGVVCVLGTGPSLKTNAKKLLESDSLNIFFAVNDFGVSDLYTAFKPKYYILLDPFYWMEEARLSEEELSLRKKLFSSFNTNTNWDMTLFIPSYLFNGNVIKNYIINPHINIKPINYLNFHPSKTKFYDFVLRHNIGVVPVGNVLGGAIYASINMGYKDVRVFGAEHSWTENIRVNDENQVCTIKKHFFEDKECLEPWRKSGGEVFRMSEILSSLQRHFYGYEFLQWYAERHDCKIFNCTKGSFIDSFKRKIDEEAFEIN